MKTYKNEVADGISEQIQANASITFESEIKIPDAEAVAKITSYASNLQNSLLDMVCESSDLAAIQSILVSTGWNGNADIFTPQELWAARKTPILKQVNLGHTAQIIGSMISSIATDFDGNLIPDDTAVADIPEEFDIVVDSVLYTRHPDKELRKAVAELLPEISNGNKRVSMECFFNNFDYGVIDSKGNNFIVPRNEETSWITKHLHQFGGTGSVVLDDESYSLGRVIRNLTFSGKGIVDDPANKRSVIFSQMQAFSNVTVKDDSDFVSKSNNVINKEEIDMPADEKTVSLKKYEELEAKLQKLEEATKASQDAKIQSYEDDIEKLTIANDELTKQLEAAIEANESAATEAEASLKIKDEELQKTLAELEQIKADSIKTERTAKLINVGRTEEEAVAIVEKWAESSDEQFASIVEMQAELIKAKLEKEAEAASDTDEPDDTEDEAEASLDVTDEGEAAPAIDEDSTEDAEASLEAMSAIMSTLIQTNK